MPGTTKPWNREIGSPVLPVKKYYYMVSKKFPSVRDHLAYLAQQLYHFVIFVQLISLFSSEKRKDTNKEKCLKTLGKAFWQHPKAGQNTPQLFSSQALNQNQFLRSP